MIRNNESGKRPYELIIGKKLLIFRVGDGPADAEKLNQIIEAEIMHAPDQYLWAHRRFKTRPPGRKILCTNKLQRLSLNDLFRITLLINKNFRIAGFILMLMKLIIYCNHV